jgi:hypothetical protein
MSESNPIISRDNVPLSGTATPEGMKQRLEDARQQLLQAADFEDKQKENDEFLQRRIRVLKQSLSSDIKELESKKEKFQSMYMQCEQEHVLVKRHQNRYDYFKKTLEDYQAQYNLVIHEVEHKKEQIKQLEEEESKQEMTKKAVKLTPHERMIVEKTKFYDTATLGGVKCSEFQKGNVPNTIVVPPPKFINGIEQLRSADLRSETSEK